MATEVVMMVWPANARPIENRSDSQDDLLGFDLKPNELNRKRPDVERNKRPSAPCRWTRSADENALRTVRRDLMALREKLLAGAGRRALLREVDYTLDRLENVLAEM